MEPGGVAEPGPGHIDHVGFPSLCARPEQSGPEFAGVGDVDLFGGDHHRHAADYLDGESGHTHLHHLGGTARRRGTPSRDPPPWSGWQFFGAGFFQIIGELCLVPTYAATETGQRCVTIRGDLAEEENSQRAFERAVTELSGLDLLVNNVATRSRCKTWPN